MSRTRAWLQVRTPPGGHTVSVSKDQGERANSHVPPAASGVEVQVSTSTDTLNPGTHGERRTHADRHPKKRTTLRSLVLFFLYAMARWRFWPRHRE
jgi:hypothetical protein